MKIFNEENKKIYSIFNSFIVTGFIVYHIKSSKFDNLSYLPHIASD